MEDTTRANTVKSVEKLNRILLIVAVIGIFSLVILNIILISKLIPGKYETALGDFPQPIILNRIPGVTGPAAKQGEVTIVRSDRCVNRDVQLTTITIWTSEDSKLNTPNSEQFKSPAMKGCATTTLALKMPEKTSPGKWFIQGIVRDDKTGDVRYWNSEIFVVVP
jgi:hypothetical protein